MGTFDQFQCLIPSSQLLFATHECQQVGLGVSIGVRFGRILFFLARSFSSASIANRMKIGEVISPIRQLLINLCLLKIIESLRAKLV